MRRLLLAAIFLCLLIQPALAEKTEASGNDAAPAKPAPEASDALRRDYDRLIGEGNLNNAVGRHVEAERAFRAALETCTRAVGESNSACVDVIIRLGLEISNQDRFEEAGLMFERAGSLAQSSGAPLDHPRVLTYRAMDLANRKDFDAALKLVLKANQQRRALIKTEFSAAKGADKNAQRRLDIVLTDLAHGLFVQAAIAMRMDRLQDAKIAGMLARRLVLKVDSAPNWWVAFVDEMLAEVDLREGNVEAAEKRLKRALKTKQLALGNTRAVALSRLALGSVYRRANRDPEAITTTRPGLAIVRGELARAPGVSPKQLLPFLKSAHAEAGRTPDNANALYTEMFAASQLLNSGSTARTISQMAARFLRDKTEVSGLVAELQEATRKRDQIRLELGRAVVTRKERANKKRIEKLRDAFAQAAKKATTLERMLAKTFPEYTTFVTALPVSTREISQLLRPDEALASFVIGDDGGFVFLVRGPEILAAPLDIDQKTLDEAVRRLRAPFEKAGRRIPAFDLAASYSLYRKLLGPVAERLDGVKHLITVANGTLLSLPFALLVTKPPAAGGNAAYVKSAWLARRMAVSVMPSIRAFTSLRGAVRASQAPKPFIGFGNPDFAGRRDGDGMAALADHCQVGAPTPPALIRRLAALPETADEIKRVARALGAGADSVHLGAAASEDRLRNMALDRYRVVYFATHGLLPGELRCQSEPSLALSPPAAPADDRARDGMLEATEIAGLRLDADLVVLSACNTGGGKSGKFGGESLSGLTRAFFQAGARALVVSHWQVDSKATARLMSTFFEGMTAGAVLAPEALRRAQMAMVSRPETAHPFFWAAFTYVGAGNGPAGEQKSLRETGLQEARNAAK